MWNEEDGFFYDVLHCPTARRFPMKVRSMVGLIPLFAVETLEPEVLDKLPGFKRRMEWFIENRPDLTGNVACMRTEGMGERRLLSMVNQDKLRSVLQFMLDENEFLSPYGIRALSQLSRDHPYVLTSTAWNTAWTTSRRNRDRPVRRQLELARADLVSGELPADRVAAEVSTITSAMSFKVEFPTGSGTMLTLWEVARRTVAPADEHLSPR